MFEFCRFCKQKPRTNKTGAQAVRDQAVPKSQAAVSPVYFPWKHEIH